MMKTNMRLSRIASGVALVGLAASLGACSDLTGLNQNPNSPTDAPPGPLFTNAVRTTVNRFRGSNFDLTMTSLFAQHFAKVSYVDEDQYSLRTATVAGHFANPYTNELMDLKKVFDKGVQLERPNVYGPALVMKTWSFGIMTDTWGDIPYSEALKGDEGGSLTPAYDPQSQIYDGFFADLKRAADEMGATKGADLGGADPIYGGNPVAWQKFANSLHARYALRIVNVDPVKADAELKAAFGAPGGVFTSNADNAVLVYPGDGVYDNTWSVNFQTRDDHRLSKTLADTLIGLVDPRITVYGQPAQADTTINHVTDAKQPCTTMVTCYGGVPNGLSTSDAGKLRNYASRPGAIFYSGGTTYGTYGNASNAKTPALLMVYAEVAFIQAEAAERGIGGLNAGQAKGFYDAAITASMKQWGISDTEITAYLAQPAVAYQGGANGLRQIALQKWIALFAQGSEAWAEYRRTGNPSTLKPGPAAILTEIPRRVAYSVDEQSVNGPNRNAAVARQGPDLMTTRIWWDKQ
jgi:hypothetical protein